MNKFALALFVLFSFVSTSSATVPSEFLLSADRAGLKNQMVAEGDKIKIYLDAGRSYECYMQQLQHQSGQEFFGFSATASGPTGNFFIVDFSPLGQKFVFTGSAAPTMSAPADPALDPSFSTPDPQQYRGTKSRFAAIPDVSGIHTFTIDGLLDVGGSAAVEISCVTNSLVGKYNRFSADLVIVELVANTNSFYAGSVIVENISGAVIASDVAIISRGRRDYIYSSLPADAIGKIVLNHSGPKGSVQGSIAQYNVGPNGELTLVSRLPMEQMISLP